MLRFGGVFIDSDVYCFKPFDPILERAEREGKSGVLAWEVQNRWLGEAVIASLPGAAFMEKVVANLEPWALARKGKAATVTVGPQYITPLLKGSRELKDVLVMPQETFFPARYDQPDLGDAIVRGDGRSPNTYACHMFGNRRRRLGTAWSVA